MMLKRRVVITGLGIVSPLGNCLNDTWEGICAGRSGVAEITRFDTTGFKTRIAGELKDFDPLTFIDVKEQRRLDNFIIYALAASEMAVSDSGLVIDDRNGERTGVILGSAIGGLSTMER
ncbi:MAG: beta-ketoacyl-[acyl-carrier-protein] synthase II, partial [Deltaproteobacteria bacterium]|nr:beta-ketoacyl-[acyl-carrier-protein] synthase II [Deltaproteobacteria bacterium]